jgi:hypothetical protein
MHKAFPVCLSPHELNKDLLSALLVKIFFLGQATQKITTKTRRHEEMPSF